MPTIYSYKVGEWRENKDKEIAHIRTMINEIQLSLENLEKRLKELTYQRSK